MLVLSGPKTESVSINALESFRSQKLNGLPLSELRNFHVSPQKAKRGTCTRKDADFLVSEISEIRDAKSDKFN